MDLPELPHAGFSLIWPSWPLGTAKVLRCRRTRRHLFMCKPLRYIKWLV